VRCLDKSDTGARIRGARLLEYLFYKQLVAEAGVPESTLGLRRLTM